MKRTEPAVACPRPSADTPLPRTAARSSRGRCPAPYTRLVSWEGDGPSRIHRTPTHLRTFVRCCRPYPSQATHKRSTNVRRRQRPFGRVTIGYPESHVRNSRAETLRPLLGPSSEGCDDGSCWQRNPDHPWWGDVVTPTCRITHQQPRGACPDSRDDTKQRGCCVCMHFVLA